MKKLLFIVTCLFLTHVTFSQGIEFSHNISFEDACKKAKAENKNIFVDVYASWCGPCKTLAKEVFPQKIVGDYFNKNFVSLSLDADKDTTNGFFELFQAKALPTLFWLSSDGKLLDMHTGLLSPEMLIERAKTAVGNNLGEQLAALEKRWNGGEHTLEVLKAYAFGGLTDPAKQKAVVEEYILGLSDKEKKTENTKKVVTPFLNRLGHGDSLFPDDILFKTYVNNLDDYSSQEDPKNINTGSFFRQQYIIFVRNPLGIYRQVRDGKADMNDYRNALAKLEALNFSSKEMYVECLRYETLLIDNKVNESVTAMKNLLEKYGDAHPHLYTDLLYSLAYNTGYFKKDKPEQIQTVLSITEQFLKAIPSKTALFYYAAANNCNGDELTATSALAWMSFYPGQVMSNAYYSSIFGMKDIRKQFPYK